MSQTAFAEDSKVRRANQRFERIVAEYCDAERAGLRPDQAALLSANPDLAEKLRDFFAENERLREAVESLHGKVPKSTERNSPTKQPPTVTARTVVGPNSG